MFLDQKEAEAVVHDAIRAARAYFGLSDEWEILVGEDALNPDVAAQITPQVDYLRAFITYDLRNTDTLEKLWIRMGHEVGHLVLVEFKLFVGALEEQTEALSPALLRVWCHADERAVSRLERMFARDRPYSSREVTDVAPPQTA